MRLGTQGDLAFPAPGLSAPPWLDRCRGLRDALLASARFQRWAAAFPLTRPVARRRARALFDLCAGFVYSQILLACVRLGLLDLLREGPQTLAALSGRMALPEDAAARLLRAAVSLRLAARRGEDRSGAERFGLGPLGAALLGNPAVAAMIEHHALLYADLGDPVALLRETQGPGGLSRYWPYADAERPAALGPAQVAPYSTLMAASQPLIAAEVLAAHRLGRYRCLLDVGGGDGAFVAAALARWPRLRATLFDLPAVADRARARFAAAGIAGRTHVAGGNFLADPLPQGADLVSLVRVIHDHGDDAALAILRAVRQALPPGGTLLIAEPMAGTPGAEPVGDAYFGFYLLAMGRGRPRTPGEIERLLRRAGFTSVRLLATRTPLLGRLIVARPAGVV